MRKNDAFVAKIVNTRSTKGFMAIFAPAESLPSPATLACEDGQQLEAHKVILASSSPFFQKILQKSKHPHPLIYLRGFQSKDFVSILDFLYFGEANVYQEDLDSFLAIAEEIQLKGLSGQTTPDLVEEQGNPIYKSNDEAKKSTNRQMNKKPKANVLNNSK